MTGEEWIITAILAIGFLVIGWRSGLLPKLLYVLFLVASMGIFKAAHDADEQNDKELYERINKGNPR